MCSGRVRVSASFQLKLFTLFNHKYVFTTDYVKINIPVSCTVFHWKLMAFNLMGLLMIPDFVLLLFSLISIYRAKHINTMLICSIWILVRKVIRCKVKRNRRGITCFLPVCGPEVLNFRIPSHVQDMIINQNIFILTYGSERKKRSILDCNEDLSLNILLWWVIGWPPSTHPVVLTPLLGEILWWKRPWV